MKNGSFIDNKIISLQNESPHSTVSHVYNPKRYFSPFGGAFVESHFQVLKRKLNVELYCEQFDKLNLESRNLQQPLKIKHVLNHNKTRLHKTHPEKK